MQINLQFSEREYLRGKASEIRFSEQKTKFSPQNFISALPAFCSPPSTGRGRGRVFISVLSQYVKEHLSRMQSRACTSYAEAMVLFEALASKIDEPNAMGACSDC